ncbi:hypothetical protein V8E36_006409 [Tilletia maclaganii]
MRQAQLSFAPATRSPDKQRASTADSSAGGDDTNSPSSSTQAPTSSARTKTYPDSTTNTPLKCGEHNSSECSSSPKGTPGFDYSMSSSPVSSSAAQSSPLAARTPSRVLMTQNGVDMKVSSQTLNEQTKLPTLKENGFEIIIPVQSAAQTRGKAKVTPAPASQSTSQPVIHQPLVTKKKKKVLTEAEKAERDAKEQEAKAKREAREQEQKAKQEAKEQAAKQKEQLAKQKTQAREAKEQEQREKQEAKEEAQRQKAEAREVKEEEQRAKKEAREARDEESRAKKEARDAEKQKKEEKARKEAATQAKTRSFMTSFLKKPGPSGSSKQAAMAATIAARANAGKNDFQRTFIPGVYKDMAPINKWKQAPSAELLRVLEGLEQADETAESSKSALATREDLLSDLKRRAPRRSASGSKGKIPGAFSSLPGSDAARTAPRRGIHPPVIVRQVMRAVAESDIIGGEAAADAKRALDRIISDRSLVRLKYIHFEQDRRPGWYGSFTRPSNLIGARTPFAQDPVLLDYSYDSDDEWEDQGQLEGEDIDDGQDAEEEDKEDDDDDSEMDDWLIDDLEEIDDAESTAGGELGPASNADSAFDKADADMDGSSDIVEVDANGRELSAAERKALIPAKRKAVDTDTVVMQRGGKQKRVKALGRRFNAKLVPFSAGPYWEEAPAKIDYALFQPFQVEFLNNASYGLNPFTFDCRPLSELVPNTESITTTTAPAPSQAAPSVSKATRKQTAGPGTLAELFAIANAQDDPMAPPGLPPFPGASANDGATEKRGRPKGVFPNEFLPDLLRLVDGSTRVKPVLLEELKEHFADAAMTAAGAGEGGAASGGTATVNVSKAAIEKKLNEVAVKDGKGKGSKWVVKGEFRAKYGLPTLATPAR